VIDPRSMARLGAGLALVNTATVFLTTPEAHAGWWGVAAAVLSWIGAAVLFRHARSGSSSYRGPY
jgi:hypothetical protein